MYLRLIIAKGPDEGKAYKIPQGKPRVVGRDLGSDIVLNDVGASRSHCRIHFDGQTCTVEDMNSKNGVVVNGRRILRRTELHDGDVLKIGTSVLKAELRDASAAGEAAAEKPKAAGAKTAAAATPAEPKVAELKEVSPSEEAGEVIEVSEDWFVPEEPAAKGVEGAKPEAETPKDGEALDLDFGGEFELEDDPNVPKKPAPVERTMDALDDAPFEVEGESKGDDSVLVDEELSKTDPRVGKVIGGFRVESRLREDDLSTIYLATQISMQRKVELRVLAEEMTRDPKAVKRLVDLTRGAGRLTHSHIQQVYDAGEAQGTYYVAFERVDGRSIEDLLSTRGENNPLPVEMVLKIGSQVADALNYAHAMGATHGRIGLDNILVTKNGMVKLAELGFAKGLENFPPALRGVSQFSAPEQLSVPPKTEARSDIYALGVVLFTLLSGSLPFKAASEQELAQKIRAGKHESLQKLRPTLPPDLVKVVEKAMSPAGKDRYANGAELLKALTGAAAKAR